MQLTRSKIELIFLSNFLRGMVLKEFREKRKVVLRSNDGNVIYEVA
jgi:hypothetical protein